MKGQILKVLVSVIIISLITSFVLFSDTPGIVFKHIQGDDYSFDKSKILEKLDQMTYKEIEGYLKERKVIDNSYLVIYIIDYTYKKYPDELLKSHPRLLIWRGTNYCIIGKVDKSAEELKKAYDIILPTGKDKDYYHSIRGKEYLIIRDIAEANRFRCIEKAHQLIPQFKKKYPDLFSFEKEKFQLIDEAYKELCRERANYAKGKELIKNYLLELKQIVASRDKDRLRQFLEEHFNDNEFIEGIYSYLTKTFIDNNVSWQRIEIVELRPVHPSEEDSYWNLGYKIYIDPKTPLSILDHKEISKKTFGPDFWIENNEVKFGTKK